MPSLHDRIPPQLRLGESIVAITLDVEVGVFPTQDYILVEIAPDAKNINVGKIAQTIRGLVKDKK
ncbi:MAG: hypothetical protein QXS20_02655, partial [Candidatus Thorarchaeota archaeon]